MNKIEKMIEELCPDGVEFRNLNEVSEMQRGTSLTKSKSVFGKYPVISGGKEPAFYCNQYNRDGEIITVAGSGVGAGYVQFWNEPIFVSDAFSIKANQDCLAKFLFYVLQSNQEYIYSKKQGAGIPHVYISDIQNLQIPIPPLKIQSEIVRMLDTFTSLVSELNTELILRRKQFQYYRDQLLTFDSGVEFVDLETVFELRNGYTPSKSNADFWTDGNIAWFRMEDIRANGRVLSDSLQHITAAGIKGKLFEKDSIILSTSATIGEHAIITVDHLTNQRFTNFKIRNEFKSRIIPKFAFYYFFKIGEWCRENVQIGNFSSVDMDRLKNFQFPVPPIEQQKKITAILDRFDKLCNDLTSGIPAEINARKKQYEFYRDKLLTFTQK